MLKNRNLRCLFQGPFAAGLVFDGRREPTESCSPYIGGATPSFSTKILAITNGGKARQRFEFKLKFGRRQIIGHAEA